MQVGIPILQRRFVCGNRQLFRKVGADMVTVSVSVNVGTPGVASWIIAHALHTALAVAPNTMMASCFFLADDLQVFSSTIHWRGNRLIDPSHQRAHERDMTVALGGADYDNHGPEATGCQPMA